MSDNDYTIMTIKPGLSLYHITPLNTPFNWEEHEHLNLLPPDVEYTYNMNIPNYYGLSEYFTLYYDVSINGKWNAAHLQFETIKPLRLLFINYKDHNIDYDKMIKKLDGWIARDDPHDGFLEVLIKNPSNSVRFIKRFDHETVKTYGEDYPDGIDYRVIRSYTTKIEKYHAKPIYHKS